MDRPGRCGTGQIDHRAGTKRTHQGSRMKEKRKGKFIPFASYLRPSEELLWQSSENVDIPASVMPTWSLSNFVSLALFLMVVGGCGFMINSNPDEFVGLLGG